MNEDTEELKKTIKEELKKAIQTEPEFKKMIQTESLVVVKNFLKNTGFTDRKLTDIPNDNLEVVNRRYVNLNGTTANRPRTSVMAQKYFDTTIGRPIYWNGSAWVDGAGSIS